MALVWSLALQESRDLPGESPLLGNENNLRSRGTASRESLTDLHLFSLEMRRWGGVGVGREGCGEIRSAVIKICKYVRGRSK